LEQVGNANGNSVAEWTDDIQLAKAAHIDGFALNIAAQDSSNAASLSNAFTAANQVGGFKMFFSFDYAAEGPWAASAVIDLLNEYGPNGAYFQYNGKPLVSTFEGPQNSGDWPSIKAATGCFFIPDWSSLGPDAAVGTGVVDGLFSWNAWPNGATDMNTASDEAYLNALAGKPYMMPVSPWFFTDLPGYGKNWLWRGDDLWYDRWQQVLQINPDLVEIITWNDYGESHYIGPLRSDDYGLFTYGQAPYNYAANMPHDAWRTFLPYVIDTYKYGNAPIPSEQVVTWYRVNPNTACSTGGTTGNTASQGQTEVSPTTVSLDKVFFSALLDGPANVDVTIGSSTVAGTWRNTPAGGSGIYHGSVPFNGATGPFTVTIWRSVNGAQSTVAEVEGAAITTACQDGIVNWNAWTGASTSSPV
jgi:Glycosyl hydrolase family 71